MLVLGLLDGALVVLGSLAEDVLLNPVDTYTEESGMVRGELSGLKFEEEMDQQLTLVKSILVLLALLAAAGHLVELAHEASRA